MYTTSVKSAFKDLDIEPDPFLGLFEGKAKERKAASQTNTNDSGSGGNTNTGSGLLGSIFSGLAGLSSAIVPTLPMLGVGSKSRIAENEAIIKANSSVLSAQLAAQQAEKKNSESMFLILGGALIFIVVLVLILRK